MDPTREIDVVPIIRGPLRVEDVIPARYILPEYALLLSGLEGVTAPDMIITAICWTLKWRPIEIKEWTIPLSPEMTDRLRLAKESPTSDQVITFLAMAGLMTISKEIRILPPANYEYLKLRWKALCATMRTTNIIEQGKVSHDVFMSMMQALLMWQNWIKPQGKLRYTLLNLIIKPREREPFVAGMVEQVLMITKDFGLKSVYLMDSLLTAGNKDILIEAVSVQADRLRGEITRLKEKYGELFPYMSVFPLEGVEALHHRNYPDLYYAAVKTAQKAQALGPEGRYIMTDVQTTIPKPVIEKMIDQPLEVEATISETTKEILERRGINVKRILEIEELQSRARMQMYALQQPSMSRP